ncbi:MAG: GmrSD restriction endonuclease domain-containing protein [Kofleriaceae bacterium]
MITQPVQLSPSELIQSVDGALARVRTRAVDVSFNELFDMHKNKELIISPDFQRLFRWTESKQSQFIESLVLELPVPPIYVIEIQDGIYELIDGLQRISSYFHFRGELPPQSDGAQAADAADASTDKPEQWLRLQDCDVLPELNGLTYSKLPQALQIKLKRHFIRMEVLRRESDKRLRYHMFKRLNTGGELLSPQEIRNCTIRLLDNTFNEFLKEVVKDPNYESCMTALTDEKRDKMYMEEYALRFFALRNKLDDYEKDIGAFLTEYMEAVSDPDADKKAPFDYPSQRKAFLDTFRVLNEALGESVFSGFNRQGKPQGYFSALHFEAITIGIQPCLDRLEAADESLKAAFKKALHELKVDGEFQKLTKGGGKNYAAALKQRVDFVRQRVTSCLL